jgi:hypothetical protein
LDGAGGVGKSGSAASQSGDESPHWKNRRMAKKNGLVILPSRLLELIRILDSS